MQNVHLRFKSVKTGGLPPQRNIWDSNIIETNGYFVLYFTFQHHTAPAMKRFSKPGFTAHLSLHMITVSFKIPATVFSGT